MQNRVIYDERYVDRKGTRYRVNIEIRVGDFAQWLAERAAANRTRRARMHYGKATAYAVAKAK